MKKALLFLAVISLVSFMSCSDDKKEGNEKETEKVDPNYPKTPEEVVQKFITNWFDLNYEEAGKYYNGDFSGVKEIDEKMGKEKMVAELEDLNVELNGEKATVTFIDRTNEKRGEIGLVKIKDQWKVEEYMIDMYVEDTIEIDSLSMEEPLEVVEE